MWAKFQSTRDVTRATSSLFSWYFAHVIWDAHRNRSSSTSSIKSITVSAEFNFMTCCLGIVANISSGSLLATFVTITAIIRSSKIYILRSIYSSQITFKGTLYALIIVGTVCDLSLWFSEGRLWWLFRKLPERLLVSLLSIRDMQMRSSVLSWHGLPLLRRVSPGNKRGKNGKTKWLTFCRRHFERHFLEQQILCFDLNCN